MLLLGIVPQLVNKGLQILLLTIEIIVLMGFKLLNMKGFNQIFQNYQLVPLSTCP